jgi:hypothetical protein
MYAHLLCVTVTTLIDPVCMHFLPHRPELTTFLLLVVGSPWSAGCDVLKLREYVDDTEDYINVMLDDKQNQLLQVGILLSTATLVMSVAIAITGVFGMNITIPLYNAPTGVFWQVTGGLVVATAAVYVVALICYKRSGILQ